MEGEEAWGDPAPRMPTSLPRGVTVQCLTVLACVLPGVEMSASVRRARAEGVGRIGAGVRRYRSRRPLLECRCCGCSQRCGGSLAPESSIPPASGPQLWKGNLPGKPCSSRRTRVIHLVVRSVAEVCVCPVGTPFGSDAAPCSPSQGARRLLNSSPGGARALPEAPAARPELRTAPDMVRGPGRCERWGCRGGVGSRLTRRCRTCAAAPGSFLLFPLFGISRRVCHAVRREGVGARLQGAEAA